MFRAAMSRPVLFTIVLTFLLASAAVAQESELPAVGTRVRVLAPLVSFDTLQGDIASYSESELTLEVGATNRVEIPFATIVRLEKAIYGNYRKPVLVGIITGALLMPLLATRFGGYATEDSKTGVAVSYGVIGGLIGAGFGGLYGSRSIREWETIIDR